MWAGFKDWLGRDAYVKYVYCLSVTAWKSNALLFSILTEPDQKRVAHIKEDDTVYHLHFQHCFRYLLLRKVYFQRLIICRITLSCVELNYCKSILVFSVIQDTIITRTSKIRAISLLEHLTISAKHQVRTISSSN